MLKKFNKHIKNEKGLTLIELLAVIVILAIIAAIAIPSIGNIIKNSQVGALKSDVLNAISAAELYLLDNPTTAAGAENKTVAMTDIINADNGYLDVETDRFTAFTYTKVGKLATFTATKNSIVLTAAAGVTKAEVIALPNNSKTGTAKIVISGR